MAHWIDAIRPTAAGPAGKMGRPFNRRRFGGWTFVSVLAIVVDTLYTWQSRAAERRHLRDMDDRQLKDIGLSRAEAEGEWRKPFWAQ